MKRIIAKLTRRSYQCSCCGQNIDDFLPALAFEAPDYWVDELTDSQDSNLTSDFCVIENESRFIRTVLRIPIIDTDRYLEWGIWVSLSEKSFKRYSKVYGKKSELKEEPYFGWFSNQIKHYPDCLKIKTLVHLQGGKMRPVLELDHENDHPLCQEQHHGITMERAHQIVKQQLEG